MATLYMMVGIVGSGKSTFAKHWQSKTGAAIVSRDKIRFSILKEGESYFSHENEVWEEYINQICEKLINGEDVIADSTNLNAKARTKLGSAIWYRMLDLGANPDYIVIPIVMNTDLVTCIERNNKRIGLELVPEKTIHSMANNFEDINIYHNGYDSVIKVYDYLNVLGRVVYNAYKYNEDGSGEMIIVY